MWQSKSCKIRQTRPANGQNSPTTTYGLKARWHLEAVTVILGSGTSTVTGHSKGDSIFRQKVKVRSATLLCVVRAKLRNSFYGMIQTIK